MAKTVIQDGMAIDWDVEIPMDDGIVLKADIFRPIKAGQYPVLLTYGPYAKGLAFQDGYPSAWAEMIAAHPDVPYGSSNKYQNWVLSIIIHRAKPKIITTALNGQVSSLGRAAKSD